MDINIKKIYKIQFAVIAVMVAAFIVFDIVPKASEIFSLWRTMLSAQKAAASLSEAEKNKIHEKFVNDQHYLDAGFQSMREIVSTVERKLSGEKDIAKMTLKLEELATSSGINLLSIKPLTTETKGVYDSVSIALEIECEYTQLIKFLSAWERSQFYWAVQDLSVAPGGAATSKLSVHLTVNVFFKSS